MATQDGSVCRRADSQKKSRPPFLRRKDHQKPPNASPEKELITELFLENCHRIGHLSILESTKIRRFTYESAYEAG